KIDAPQPPHSQGFGETLDRISGFTREFRQTLREAVLDATPQMLQNSAQSVLHSPNTAVTILGGGAAFDTAETQGLSLNREPLIQ
ncbi:MAG TPA: hypothetical protein VHO70_05665, partial [Chitinispirillaceae bacterium]|nr:hypothetical protein [Chitinispirillaceae bacterium]